jgi:hypothetical protein
MIFAPRTEIRATRVSKWQLDARSRHPPALVMIKTLALAIPTSLHPALTLRARMIFAPRTEIRATRVSKWQLDARPRHPPALTMIETFAFAIPTSLHPALTLRAPMIFAPRTEIRATRVIKWQLDVGTRHPPALVMIKTLAPAIPMSLHPALTLRAPMIFAPRTEIRATRVSKWQLDARPRHPPTLVMIKTLAPVHRILFRSVAILPLDRDRFFFACLIKKLLAV